MVALTSEEDAEGAEGSDISSSGLGTLLQAATEA